MNFQELEDLWIANGGSQATAPIMAAIAMAESTGDVTNYNGTDPYGGSYGLWQINGSHTTGYGGAFDVNQLYNAGYNANAAIQLSGNGQYLTPWTTFKSWVAGDGGHGDQVISQYMGKYTGQIPTTGSDPTPWYEKDIPNVWGDTQTTSTQTEGWLQQIADIKIGPFPVGQGMAQVVAVVVVGGAAAILFVIGGAWLISGNKTVNKTVTTVGKTAAKVGAMAA